MNLLLFLTRNPTIIQKIASSIPKSEVSEIPSRRPAAPPTSYLAASIFFQPFSEISERSFGKLTFESFFDINGPGHLALVDFG